MTKPITPAEARHHASPIPDAVFEVFNLFVSRGAGLRAVTILQKDVETELRQRGIDTAEAFERHWLDVEGVYEAAGWKVEYDKPGYNETYEASWRFTPKMEPKR